MDSLFSDSSNGRSRVARIKNVDVSDFPWQRGAEIGNALATELSEPRFVRYSRLALEDALADADVSRCPLPRARTGVALGTTLGLVDELTRGAGPLSLNETRRRLAFDTLIDDVSRGAVLEGPKTVFSLACASGLCAAEQAALELELGRADAMVVGGADTLGRFMQGGFCSLHAFAPSAGDSEHGREGLVLGEGAAFVVLEPREAARARDRAYGAALKAQRLTSDGYHLASPDPSGSGMAQAITLALDDAELEPSDIGAIVMTALGSMLHERMLKDALSSSLGSRASEIPVTSHEAAIGHVLAASGVLVLAYAARLLSEGNVRPAFSLDSLGTAALVSASPCSMPLRERNILTLSVGFGGFNGVAIVGSAE